jgi:hypothetical protein
VTTTDPSCAALSGRSPIAAVAPARSERLDANDRDFRTDIV